MLVAITTLITFLCLGIILFATWHIPTAFAGFLIAVAVGYATYEMLASNAISDPAAIAGGLITGEVCIFACYPISHSKWVRIEAAKRAARERRLKEESRRERAPEEWHRYRYGGE